MSGHKHGKQSKRRTLRWLPAAGMLTLFALGLLVWKPAAKTPEPVNGQTVIPVTETEPPVTFSGAENVALRVMSTPEPIPVPAGTGRYVSDGRTDGYAVSPRADACWPGMSDLAEAAQQHTCRFMSGSGELLPDYDFGEAVPESQPVEDSFFSDSVFIGNSLEQGFMLYAGLRTADIFATQSINVTNIYFTKVVEDEEAGMLTLLEAMARKQYAKVFVMLGVNELSYATKDSFYNEYAQLIDDIREMEPGAAIFLQSITPVSAKENEASTVFNNKRIHEFNEIIQQLAADKEAHYLHVYDALADEEGCLPEGSSDDGIHPYPKYYSRWLAYLRSHTVTEVIR